MNAQLECFKTGFPWLKLAGAASPGNGITVPTEAEKKDYLAAWDAYLDGTGKVLKFVPASGAASRMFKNLFEFLDNGEKTEFIQKFEANLDKFAFIDDEVSVSFLIMLTALSFLFSCILLNTKTRLCSLSFFLPAGRRILSETRPAVSLISFSACSYAETSSFSSV